MELVHPEWLLLLALLPLAEGLRRRRAAELPLPRAGELRRADGRFAPLLGRAPGTLRLLVLALLVLALARPRTAGGVEETSGEGVPIVVAIDASSSMLAQDWRCAEPPCAPGDPPRDRLQVAKATVAEFVAARRDDPIGIVAFAAEAITLVPVTTSRPLLRSALQNLEVGLLEDGTAIGEGLATAVNRLRRVPGEDRVVILMSDGESNRGIDPLTAAQAAAQLGIRVFTIGVGSEGTAPVPVQRAPEGFRYVERPVAIDEALLRRIAELTGGEYHRATSPEALGRIYGRIDRLVQAPVETRRRVRYREWYLWLLAAAAGVLLLEWGMRGSRWGAVP